MIYPVSEPKTKKPSLLFISHVIPLDPSSGQQQRVSQMITESKKYFNIIFLTFSSKEKIQDLQERMSRIVDHCIVLPSKYDANLFNKIWYSLLAFLFRIRTGLKKSNFIIGQVELTNERISKVLKNEKIDLVIYEYWHAWKSTNYFKHKNIPVLLDMHDILSNAYTGQLDRNKWMLKPIRKRRVKQYTLEEYSAWENFDGIIAINEKELEVVQKHTKNKHLFFCPMGIDLRYWKYSWQPTDPPRFGFYGGLGSLVNQLQAIFTVREIMPRVWKEIPNAEIWLVGSNPNKEMLKLTSEDSRIMVTGYLEDPRQTLGSFTALFCPWKGIFGFRSRIVEVMALGVPVIASPDAFFGMGLITNNGILPAINPQEFLNIASKLVIDRNFAQSQSKLARLSIEKQFSTEATYNKLFSHLKQTLP